MMAKPVFAGIYSPPWAARYLLASRGASEIYPVGSRTIVRWAKHGLADPALAGLAGREMIFSFEDLVSLRVIAALRAASVPWRTIRRAEQWLRETTGSERPFAREEVWSSTTDIFTRLKGMLISAGRYGQIAMGIMLEYLMPVSGLSFENRIARSWEPMPLIVLDPKIQFGEPCIRGTRIPAQSVASMVRSGDDKSLVMQVYGLSDSELTAALEWSNRVAA